MDLHYSQEHLAIKNSVKDFAESELLPGVIERDEKQCFPKELRLKMADMGLLGMMVNPTYGGAGMDTVSYVLAIEEIAKIDASAAVMMSVNNSLVCWGLENYASEEIKQKYLVPLATGEKLGAFCLSEPEAGSDATSQQTTAIDCGEHYLVNGTKNWITNGNTSDICLVIAQTKAHIGHKGINALVIEKNTEGFVVGKKEHKMGIKASDTHSLMFTDVKVPKSNRIGTECFGFKFAMSVLNGGRIGIAAQALGIASGAFEIAKKYANERKTFGKPIGQHQAIAFKLADMATQISGARMLCLKAAYLKDNHQDYTKEAAMAKLFASRVAMEVTTEAVQILGGYGYVQEYHVERMMRDAKITQIYEGTSEIQKIVISRELLK